MCTTSCFSAATSAAHAATATRPATSRTLDDDAGGSASSSSRTCAGARIGAAATSAGSRSAYAPASPSSPSPTSATAVVYACGRSPISYFGYAAPTRTQTARQHRRATTKMATRTACAGRSAISNDAATSTGLCEASLPITRIVRFATGRAISTTSAGFGGGSAASTRLHVSRARKASKDEKTETSTATGAVSRTATTRSGQATTKAFCAIACSAGGRGDVALLSGRTAKGRTCRGGRSSTCHSADATCGDIAQDFCTTKRLINTFIYIKL